MNKIVTIFTDGSAKANGLKKAVGGIGIFISSGHKLNVGMETRKALSLLIPDLKIEKLTNNISELTAILFALKSVNEHQPLSENKLLIKSDSNYSINCLTKWYPQWERNGWLSSKGQPVLNKELIKEILFYIKKYPNQILFKHVKAHKKNPGQNSPDFEEWYGNNEADKLSNSFLVTL